MKPRMFFDDVTWEQADYVSDNWLLQFLDIDIKRPIAKFIFRHDSGDDPEFTILGKGSFNIENTTSVYDALNTPGCPKEERGVLDPDIDEGQLENIYTQLARILPRLSKPEFPSIGSLSQVDDITWAVTRRPLSMNMNELVRLGTLPRSKVPPLDATFSTASSYIEYLAQLAIQHLLHQGMTRCNLQMTAVASLLQDSYSTSLLGTEAVHTISRKWSFKLWCDDIRPANVLLNEDMHIAGVVDWEFTHAAPVEFSHAPPWSLLIEKPEYWSKGIDGWTRVFDRRLKTFLASMRHCEDEDTQPSQSRRLSDQMRQSWESGDFWVVYAILHSFAFDAIYWQKIFQRFFGPMVTSDPSEAWKERLGLLDENQRDEMEQLVTRKLEEMENRVLAWDPDEYNEEFRQKLMQKREEEANEAKKSSEEPVEGTHE